MKNSYCLPASQVCRADGGRSVVARRLLAVTLTAGALLMSPLQARADTADSNAVYFDINRFDVRGNSMLPAEKVTALLAPYTGKRREFAELLASDVTGKWHYTTM